MKASKNTVICILGPTASGKTDLAMALYDRFPATIISVDSAMVYRDMDIGTAKPAPEELTKYPHRLIDICDPSDVYSAGDFCVDAIREIADAIVHNRVPILVGGTMLYFHKLLHGMAKLPAADLTVRAQLEKKAQEVGWAAMHAELEKIDPVAAAKIKPTDPQRIQRALEVYEITGKPISYFHQQSHENVLSSYRIIQIGLFPQDRQWLHDRIAKRFDAMLSAGFLAEAKQFYDDPKITAEMPSMRMVGYRQAWDYFSGTIDLNTMKEKAVAATRQLAKRQLTWMRSWDGLQLFDPKESGLLDNVCNYLGFN